MDASTFATLFSDVGFPTALCAFLIWVLYQDRKQHREDRKEDKSLNDTLIASLKTSIDNNTSSTEKLETLITKVLVRIEDVQDTLDNTTSKRGK